MRSTCGRALVPQHQRGPQRSGLLVDGDQAVRATDADNGDFASLHILHGLANGANRGLPPSFGIMLCLTGKRTDHLAFAVTFSHQPAFEGKYPSFRAGAADVDTEQITQFYDPWISAMI
jgi:hypothetical protein